jgi:hypothetical protein
MAKQHWTAVARGTLRIYKSLGIDFEARLRSRVDIAGGLDLLDAPLRAEQEPARFGRKRPLGFVEDAFERRPCQFDQHPHFP